MKSAIVLLVVCLTAMAVLASASSARHTTPWHALEGAFFNTLKYLNYLFPFLFANQIIQFNQ
jgi:hypothetical protein